MEENGNMIWNIEEGYLKYKASLDNLKQRLGIGAVDYEVRPELAPYITEILGYLDMRLIQLGDDAEIIDKLNEIFDIFSYGADLIVGLEANTLAEEIGIDISEENSEHEDYIPYYSDRFIFAWTNVLSCLVTRLKLTYAGLLTETVSQGCPCCCGSEGETWKDWESWSSGIYPEDEEYGVYNLGTTQTYRAGGKNGNSCNCGYRL